jgi:hypothetical protein
MNLFRAASFVYLLILALQASGQTTVTLQDGLNNYSGTRDNDPLWSLPDTNRGSQQQWGMHHWTSFGMVRFNIFANEGGPVPNGASITSATLSVYQDSGPTSTYDVRRFLKNWQEMQATWNVAATGLPWETAGALGASDVAPVEGQVAMTTIPGWLSFNVTSSLQAFANGTADNYGWKVGWVGGTTGPKFFWTREKAAPSPSTLHPKLVITYNTACTGSGPFGGTPTAVPGKVEAENFDCGGAGVAYHDATPGNQSNSQYRATESVDVMDLADRGRAVQYFDTGEWLRYTINVPTAGTYDLEILAASSPSGGGGAFRIDVDGVNVTGSVAVPVTGSWDSYQWVTGRTALPLAAGSHTLTLVSVQQSFRVDKMRVSASPVASCNTGPLRPYKGVPFTVPGIFEGEHFDCGGEGVGYHDINMANNAGQTFRADEAVEIIAVTGAVAVNQFDAGEWLSYTIDVPAAGQYEIGVLVTAGASGGGSSRAFRIAIDGTDLPDDVTFGPTADWETYAWFCKPVTLTQGQHQIKITSITPYFRVEKVRVLVPGTDACVPPTEVEDTDEPEEDCARPGQTHCLRFEPAETDFSVANPNQIMLKNGTADLFVNVQNKRSPGDNPDPTGAEARLSLVAIMGRDGTATTKSAMRFTTLESDTNVHGSGSWERSELRFPNGTAGGSAVTWYAHSVLFPKGVSGVPDFKMPPPQPWWQFSFFWQFADNDNGVFGLSLRPQPGSGSPGRVSFSATQKSPGNNGFEYYHNYGSSSDISGKCLQDSYVENTWYDFVHEVKFHLSNGYHRIWMREGNGEVKLVLNQENIRTLHFDNAANTYMKLGTYHDPVPGASSVMHDRVRRGSSYDAVRIHDVNIKWPDSLPMVLKDCTTS